MCYTAQHSMAPGAGLLCRPMIATWPYFSPGQSSSPMTPDTPKKNRSSTGQSVPVCCPSPWKGGRERGRKHEESRNNSTASVAHPPKQCSHRQMHPHNNTKCMCSFHPHSTLIMIRTKPHEHLPTSAQEPQPNTNTEPKHIVESLSLSLWPDFFFFCVVRPTSAASQLCFQFSSPRPDTSHHKKSF